MQLGGGVLILLGLGLQWAGAALMKLGWLIECAGDQLGDTEL